VVGRIDPGLAANRAVHLRQKRSRDLHEPHATAQYGGGKARQITDDPAAKRDDDVAPFDPFGQKPFNGAGELRPTLRRLAGRQGQRAHRHIAQPGAERLKMQGTHGLVGDNRHARAPQQRRDFGPGACQKPTAHPHVVGSRAQIDAHNICRSAHVSSVTSPWVLRASTTLAAICSTDKSASASTTTSASA